MSIGILIVSIFALVFYLGAVLCYFIRRSLVKIFELIGVALLLTFTILAMCNNFSFGQYGTAVIVLLLITLVCLTFIRILALLKISIGVKSTSSSKSSKKSK